MVKRDEYATTTNGDDVDTIKAHCRSVVDAVLNGVNCGGDGDTVLKYLVALDGVNKASDRLEYTKRRLVTRFNLDKPDY
jgi:ADP-ribosylglycohydrolase